MKSKNTIIILAAIAVMSVLTLKSQAQDAVKATPNTHKLLKDTLGMRMLMATIKPGETTAMHSHPAHMGYVLEGGKLEITNQGQPPVTMEVKPGDVLALPAVTHQGKNVGTTTLKVILFEKESMYDKK